MCSYPLRHFDCETSTYFSNKVSGKERVVNLKISIYKNKWKIFQVTHGPQFTTWVCKSKFQPVKNAREEKRAWLHAGLDKLNPSVANQTCSKVAKKTTSNDEKEEWHWY